MNNIRATDKCFVEFFVKEVGLGVCGISHRVWIWMINKGRQLTIWKKSLEQKLKRTITWSSWIAKQNRISGCDGSLVLIWPDMSTVWSLVASALLDILKIPLNLSWFLSGETEAEGHGSKLRKFLREFQDEAVLTRTKEMQKRLWFEKRRNAQEMWK